MFFPSIFVYITISHLIAPPTRLLVLCHLFGTFFVRVCGVTSFSSMFYRYGFCRRPKMTAVSIGRIIICVHFGLFVCPTWYSRVPIYTCSVCTIPLLHERPDQKYEILNIFNLHDIDQFTRAEHKITHQIRGVLLFFLGGRVADALRVCKR